MILKSLMILLIVPFISGCTVLSWFGYTKTPYQYSNNDSVFIMDVNGTRHVCIDDLRFQKLILKTKEE